VPVPLPNGGAAPLGEVASVELTRGPAAIRTENGQLATYIYVDIRDRDRGSHVNEAQRAVAASVKYPAPSRARR
jgi:Cu(I)/Ag(I) efflux system membrane protein CusA/SilA